MDYMLLSDTIINDDTASGETTEVKETTTETTSSETGTATEVATQEEVPFYATKSFIIGIYVVMAIIFYVFFMKPNKKRQEAIKEQQSSLKIGDEVVTTTGVYGTIADVGTDVFVVEFGLNKGVRIPIKKEDVFKSSGYDLSKPSKNEDEK